MRFLKIEPTDAKTYLLFDTFDETFHRAGHSFVDDPNNADVALFDLCCGEQKFDRSVLMRVLEIGMPVVPFDQFEYTNPLPESPVWLGVGTKHDLVRCCGDGQEWAIWLRNFMDHGQVKCLFVRRMPSMWVDFPDFCVPFDQCAHPDAFHPPTTKQELNSRPVDICFIGGSCEWRDNMVRDLLKCRTLKVDLEFITTKRIERVDWLARHRRAKLFFSGDGPGDCSDRSYELPAIAPMLKFRNFHRLPVPWTHGVDCIEGADAFGNMEPLDEFMIRSFLDDPEKLYSIYLGGIDHLQRCSQGSRAKYVLEKLKEKGIIP